MWLALLNNQSPRARASYYVTRRAFSSAVVSHTMYSHRKCYEIVRCYLQVRKVYAEPKDYESQSLPRLQRAGLVNARIPNRQTILAVNQRLLDHGQFVTPTHAQGRGAHRLPVELTDVIFDFFEQNPRASTRDAARQFDVSAVSVWKLLNTARLHPYHYRKVQTLHEHDALPRRIFCEWLIAHTNAFIMWTDEALFTRVGLYNQHNEHFWSYQNPHVIRESHHQVRFSANVWAGIMGNKILGPYFIEGRLTGVTYLDMLRGIINDLMDDVPLAMLQQREFYFQHDVVRVCCS